MVKGSRRWAKTTWPMERLHGLHDDIFTRLMEGDGGIPWSTQAWLGEWSDELGDLSDLRYDWVDPGTDDTPNTSLTYVARYAFYIDGRRRVPSSVQRAIGKSFCAEPIDLEAPAPSCRH
ncbi:hypothetical protein PC116_g20345 [Phytophthora cactorum]|uniref:Uncharacterized protein n=1 Tax=Phytophthora cactorum TaxID=29920 RepID=A0A329SUI8_9STRA|nr:hypothetical protein PC116_g20345 [Phytophthora cactorum]RAW39616.1 hypothetical protein PC110_g4172 [Phytophthora cactorum]